MASRFQPSNFQHNLRVAAALVPSLAVLAGFGGKVTAGLLLVSPGVDQSTAAVLCMTVL